MLLKVDIGSNISMKAFGRSENTLMAESVGCGLWVMGYGLWVMDIRFKIYKTLPQLLSGHLPISGWITGGKDVQQLTCCRELC
jgi:hypothetical protein